MELVLTHPEHRSPICMFDPFILKYQLRDAALYWVAIPAAVIVSGRAVDFLFGLPLFSLPTFLAAIATLLLLAGLILIWLSMQDLASAGGTPNPRRPPKKIVTSRSYSICRHPMFLGYDLCALSVILFWGSRGMLLISFPVFLLLQVRFLQREEKILLSKFKQAYADYAARTPLLFPLPSRKQFFKRQIRRK
jgi:protein-S-isoprenylcysteine O-methyltransferase Ste14